LWFLEIVLMTAGGTPGFRNSRDGYSTFLKLWHAPVYQNPLLLESVEPPNLASSATCPLGTLVALLSCEQSHSKAGKRLAACPLLRSHRAVPPRNLGGCFGSKKNLRAHAEDQLSGGLADETRHQEGREIVPSQGINQESHPGEPSVEASSEENRESGDT